MIRRDLPVVLLSFCLAADDEDPSSPGNEDLLDVSPDFVEFVFHLPMKSAPSTTYRDVERIREGLRAEAVGAHPRRDLGQRTPDLSRLDTADPSVVRAHLRAARRHPQDPRAPASSTSPSTSSTSPHHEDNPAGHDVMLADHALMVPTPRAHAGGTSSSGSIELLSGLGTMPSWSIEYELTLSPP